MLCEAQYCTLELYSGSRFKNNVKPERRAIPLQISRLAR